MGRYYHLLKPIPFGRGFNCFHFDLIKETSTYILEERGLLLCLWPWNEFTVMELLESKHGYILNTTYLSNFYSQDWRVSTLQLLCKVGPHNKCRKNICSQLTFLNLNFSWLKLACCKTKNKPHKITSHLKCKN